jgi:hypothetical protein
MGSNLQFANADTPTPGSAWIGLSEDERLSRLKEAVACGMPSMTQLVAIASAKDDGQVIVRLQEALPASQRGGVLLDLEDFLKGAVDPGLAVWLEGLGDRNSLRNLRGIEVKA